MNNLKPCPFCGSSVSIRRSPGDWGYIEPRVFVRCDVCSIGFGATATQYIPGKGTIDVSEEVTQELIRRWNRRAEIDDERS